jgi:transcriptional regulator
MYQPSHFVENDPDVLLALMRESPFATLIHGAAGELAADVLPLEVDRTEVAGWRITGHVARANPLWKSADGQPVLAVFQGAQAYISPNWYPSKAEHGKAVPTWNYTLVQAHGRLRAIEDREWLRALVGRLTARHEGGRASPWHVSDAPADYLDSMLRAIVGIEIEVSRIEGKFKLSQNRPADDRTGTLAGLASDTALGIQPQADRVRRAMEDAEARRIRGEPPATAR